MPTIKKYPLPFGVYLCRDSTSHVYRVLYGASAHSIHMTHFRIREDNQKLKKFVRKYKRLPKNTSEYLK